MQTATVYGLSIYGAHNAHKEKAVNKELLSIRGNLPIEGSKQTQQHVIISAGVQWKEL